MVIYPGRITIGRGTHRGEACVAITVADATGRSEPVVVLVEWEAFSRALTGEGQQPCAVQVQRYLEPTAVTPVADNVIEMEGYHGRNRLRSGRGVRGDVGRDGRVDAQEGGD